MALIKINIADSLLSESAKAQSAYHLVPSNGALVLVINSKHKPTVTGAATKLKKAKTLGIAAAKLAAKTAKSKESLRTRTKLTAEAKDKLRKQIKDNNAIVKRDIAEAKDLAKAAVAQLKAAGLSNLDPTIKTSYMIVSDPEYTLGKISKAKPDSFRVQYKGAHAPVLLKPRYATGAKFDKIGEKVASSAPAKAKRTATKPNKGGDMWNVKMITGHQKGTQHKTEGQLRDAANKELAAQSKQWDKDTRSAKRMMKELNGGKAITEAAGWTGTVVKGRGVFTNKRGDKLVVKKSDMAKHGLTPDSFKRALGEANVKDSGK